MMVEEFEVDEDLPPTLAAIAGVAGVDAAIEIARHHGGTRVTVPVSAGDNWLTQLVGAEKAAAIIEALGPARRLDVPLGVESGYTFTSRRQLNRRMAEMDASGATASEMARALGIPDRRVRRWRASRRAGPNGRQADLFE